MNRARAGGQVMKPVLQRMMERVNPVLGEFAADALAERAVERREHRARVLEREGQQWQSAGRRQIAQGGAGDEEFEGARAHVGEHLGVRAEPAFGKHLEPELPVGFPADRLGHLSEPSSGGAAGRLVEAEAMVEARGVIAFASGRS